ncbi:MAG: aminotransferase class III-fold pyridoxal phosphate-dependent enzyme [Acidobacteriota bacterium]
MAISPQDIAQLARESFGLEVAAEALDGDVDQNFLLRQDSGERLVLKVAQEGRNQDLVALESSVFTHLAEYAVGIALPHLVGKGQWQGRQVRLLSWVPGELWVHRSERSAALRRDLGRALGRLDAALADFVHPAADRDHDWDLRHASRAARNVRWVPEASRRALLDAALQQYSGHLRALAPEVRRAVIHGDANDYNVTVSADGERVAGLFDFGDLGVSWLVAEPAISAAYIGLGEDDPWAAACDLLAGYQREYPLTDEEIGVFYPLVCTRLVVSIATAARRRAAGSSNAYHFATEERAWAALAKLMQLSPARARQEALEACGRPATAPRPFSKSEILAARQRHVGPSLSVSYRQPLHFQRGRGPYLFDQDDRPFLDLVNNVCHVGHCHPRVVAAAQRQMAQLNTNTRYLYAGLTEYATRLTAKLPEPLSVCYLVNSGSEANELALRLAQCHTGRDRMVVLEGAYHGHTGRLIELSPYKFRGPGGRGEPTGDVTVVPAPDSYRGRYRAMTPATGRLYAAEVESALAAAATSPAAFLAESLLSCGGQVEPPPEYFAGAFAAVRAAGGLCIIDEVQVGFGRVGDAFWGFELQGVVPDVVVMGKPIGNGHPLAAVVTTPEIASSFDNGMEFFCTFGGNPVSCAVGLAVLDVVEEEGLQERARRLGQRFRSGLEELATRHPLIGDVRGRGLFLGVELVRDRSSLEPAATEAQAVVEAAKQQGILLSTDGPLHNVIKIKPPLALDEHDVDRALRALDSAFAGVQG